MAEKKTLTFKVHKDGELVNPTWHRVEVENAECPNCHQTMVVFFSPDKDIYAFCARCQQYYIGEANG